MIEFLHRKGVISSLYIYDLSVYGDTFDECYRGWRLVHFTDSQVVETVMRKGSPVRDLHDMVWSILNDCRSHGIKLSVVWQPREDVRLVQADAASRRFGADDSEALALDLDDWGLANMDLPLSLGPPFHWTSSPAKVFIEPTIGSRG